MEWIGIIGAASILGAFIGNELAWWNRRSVRYDVINAVGASLLLVYAWQLDSLPFTILNLAWLLFALKDIIRRFL